MEFIYFSLVYITYTGCIVSLIALTNQLSFTVTKNKGKWCLTFIYSMMGFPCGSAGKESTCNLGHPGSIPELGRSLEKGKATHSNILAWRIPWTSPWVAKSRTRLSDFHFHFIPCLVVFISICKSIFLTTLYHFYWRYYFNISYRTGLQKPHFWPIFPQGIRILSSKSCFEYCLYFNGITHFLLA